MRNIPTITKNLLIINILAFLAMIVLQMRGIDLNNIMGLHFIAADDFRPWQFVTYMFMHGGFTHIFFNMFALWMFGCTLERVWGEKRFLWFYLICGIGAGLVQELSQMVEVYFYAKSLFPEANFSEVLQIIGNSGHQLNGLTTVGASGAIYGILLGFGLTFPEERIFIFPIPFPIKGKWFVCVYAVIELVCALGTSSDGVAHIAHLGGMLFGWLILRYWRNHNGGSQFGGWDGYEIKESRWEKVKKWFSDLFKKKNANRKGKFTSTTTRGGNPDWEYNQRSKADEQEIDRILDKIRKNGYDSLTEQEKKKLFDRK